LFFCKSRMVSPFVFKIKTWQVLRMSCWVLLRVLLCSADRTLKLTFSTVILSCRCDRLRHFNSVNSSLTYVFLLADFVYISYLTHFAITTLVIFAELCILLCCEVFVLKFRWRVSIFVLFLSTILLVLAQFCRSSQSFLLISPFCTQFCRFALNFTFLYWWNCTDHWFGINWCDLGQSDCRNCCFKQ